MINNNVRQKSKDHKLFTLTFIFSQKDNIMEDHKKDTEQKEVSTESQEVCENAKDSKSACLKRMIEAYSDCD